MYRKTTRNGNIIIIGIMCTFMYGVVRCIIYQIQYTKFDIRNAITGTAYEVPRYDILGRYKI